MGHHIDEPVQIRFLPDCRTDGCGVRGQLGWAEISEALGKQARQSPRALGVDAHVGDHSEQECEWVVPDERVRSGVRSELGGKRGTVSWQCLCYGLGIG